MSAKSAFILVNNVNSARQRHADFDIHVAGCPALKKVAAADQFEHTATDADDVIKQNVDDLAAEGFGEDAENFSHRVHSCAKGSTRRGATGPRYTEAQISAGLAARREGKSNKAVAEAAGVKSPSYFTKVLKGLDGLIARQPAHLEDRRKAPESVREQKGQPRKWTAEVSCGGQPVPFEYGNSDTLEYVRNRAVEAANRAIVIQEMGSDASVIIFKQLAGDVEPKRDRSVYLYRDDRGKVRAQRST